MTRAAALAEHWRASTPRLTTWPAIEAGLALIAMLLFSQALLGPLLADPADPEGGAVLRLIWPPVYLLALGLIALNPSPVLQVVLRAWPLVLLGALTLVSGAWSIDPGLTMRRGLAVFMTLVFALWLAARYSWPDLIRLIALMFAILAIGSFIAGALFPSFGVMYEIHVGAWKGLWWEKNTLGGYMAFGAGAFAAASVAARDRTESRIWLGFLLLAVALVLLSTSRTALLATLICTAGPAAIALARRGFGFAVLAIFSGVCGLGALAGVVIIGPGVILEALGRDPTLTGRTDIWAALGDAIAARPWTGYGYGVFWEIDDGPVFWVRQATVWPVPTAHNAWLETALAIGLPGMALAMAVVLGGWLRALSRLFSGVETYWALPFITAWIGVSLSESNLLVQNGMIWMVLAATLAKLAARTR
ncbi:MAG: O-antigen ligase family protein [Alphaproteobacteria bacterium]|nr:O-antigen ligase family protein [Alphaproteobacteria bacterium]